MAGSRKTKRSNFKDGDWIFLHREPQGLGIPHVIDGRKSYAMTVRDFFSDVLTGPVTDTDAANAGVENLLMRPVGYRFAAPATADVDWFVTTTNMKVGAYTIANATPTGGGARNVTVTTTDDNASDTVGTVDIVGTDIDDQVLLETITLAQNATVQGTRAFKTVVSATGVAWVEDAPGEEDEITIGFGDLIGLPDYLLHDTVLFAMLNNVREGTHPTVTSSTTVLALNTVDLNTALGGTAVVIYYLVGKWI